jgi:hypothetical protein
MKSDATFDERGESQIMASSERSDWLHDVNSVLVSAICHFSLLIAIGLTAAGGSRGPRGVELELSLGGGPNGAESTTPALDDTPLEAAIAQAEAANPVTALKPVAQIDPSAEALATVNPPEVSTSPMLPSGAMTVNSTDLTDLGTAMGGANGRTGSGFADGGVGRGGGKGDGKSSKAATDFFGIEGYGQTFVYVVDCSDSMNDSGKFDRARYELLQSIEQLSSDQRYFIFFYNDRTYPMDGNGPVANTEDQFAATTRWVNQIQAHGGTNPLPAVLAALAMRPDAIYFLSDGQFNPLTIHELRFRNTGNPRKHVRPIPIHTIAFVDRFAEGIMKMIAKNSGGEFRFVP